jgi:hypothetical protein
MHHGGDIIIVPALEFIHKLPKPATNLSKYEDMSVANFTLGSVRFEKAVGARVPLDVPEDMQKDLIGEVKDEK